MILVTGATGYVGSRSLARLASMGLPAAGLVRVLERARAALPAGVPHRVADYDDWPALRRALEGISTLLFVASDGAGADVMRHHANVIEAAAVAGVGRIVFTSITDLDPASPFYFTPVYRDAESRLAPLGERVTLVRCGLYSDFLIQHWVGKALATGTLSLPVGEALVATVTRDDVAEALAVAVASDAHRGETYRLTGPAAHDFREIARLAAAAAGTPLRYEPCPPSDYLARAWRELEDPWPHAFTSLCASIVEGRYAETSPNIEVLLGRPAEGLGSFFRRTLGAAPGGSGAHA